MLMVEEVLGEKLVVMEEKVLVKRGGVGAGEVSGGGVDVSIDAGGGGK